MELYTRNGNSLFNTNIQIKVNKRQAFYEACRLFFKDIKSIILRSRIHIIAIHKRVEKLAVLLLLALDMR